jgi:hypothetical protein
MRLFRRSKLIGFNLARAFNTEHQQDAAFQAIRGTTAACISTADAIGKWGHSVIYIPMIVVDSPLLQCYLPADKEGYALEETREGTILYNTGLVDASVDRSNILTVHVLNIDALRPFLETVKQDATSLYEFIRPAIKQARQK